MDVCDRTRSRERPYSRAHRPLTAEETEELFDRVLLNLARARLHLERVAALLEEMGAAREQRGEERFR